MRLIRWMFFKKKHLAYTAFGDAMYYQAVDKLRVQGIDYDTVLRVNANVHGTEGHLGSSHMRDAMTNTAQYDLYVEIKDKHFAEQILNG
ncbi:hypothetical protein [Planococcus faecalis]|uniref:DUF2007 domain-containing protein n=1 Tax=Planococcus faecalis TaxID=1598147 RepID=A0ABN4XFK7_9BACL|nr:hypothetical protein [Planococcus faecalis]AQU78401.1 hypothetical protein AJGP001_03405 [Planococcus faecalis]OHX52399.1 hypothetical protein BB777_12210 [Planococcus faecalis]